MPKGLEVELELLGVKGRKTANTLFATALTKSNATESVELLAAVAQIDADQTPPCCLEIAQLVSLNVLSTDHTCSLNSYFSSILQCGRLPLCLNVRCCSMCCVAEAEWSICFADRGKSHQDFWSRLGGRDPQHPEERHEKSKYRQRRLVPAA